MYICICQGISDRQIRETVRCGASNLHEVQAQLPVAQCCGCCEGAARDLIDGEIQSKQKPAAA